MKWEEAKKEWSKQPVSYTNAPHMKPKIQEPPMDFWLQLLLWGTLALITIFGLGGSLD